MHSHHETSARPAHARPAHDDPHYAAMQAIARRYIGPPALFVAALAGVLLAALAASTIAALAGTIPLWLGTLFNTLLLYWLFTPVHEAIHGTIRGADRRLTWLNDLVGWVGGMIAIVPFRAEARLHFLHHRYTNDPKRDPDFSIAARAPVEIALRCLMQLPAYVHHFVHGDWSGTPQRRRDRWIGVLHLVVALALLLLSFPLGFALELVALWLLPAMLGVALVAFVFDWLVHQPYRDTAPLQATKVVLGRGLLAAPLTAFCLWQNYHLVHHLFPGIPCHRLGRAYARMRPHLEALGARPHYVGPALGGGGNTLHPSLGGR